jgi:hypothetical protein
MASFLPRVEALAIKGNSQSRERHRQTPGRNEPVANPHWRASNGWTARGLAGVTDSEELLRKDRR